MLGYTYVLFVVNFQKKLIILIHFNTLSMRITRFFFFTEIFYLFIIAVAVRFFRLKGSFTGEPKVLRHFKNLLYPTS